MRSPFPLQDDLVRHARKTSSPPSQKAVVNGGAAERPERWVVLSFEPVAPFSLRSSLSTSAGGKTLLVPTPFAVKMALLDATARSAGSEAADRLLRALLLTPVAIVPSRWATVTNTFERVLRLNRGDGKAADDEADPGANDDQNDPFMRTIRYREICFLSGPLTIGLGLRTFEAALLIEAARQVNYFGRRGGFFQLVKTSVQASVDERATIVDPCGWAPPTVPAGEVVAPLDDMGPGATLERISPFSDQGASWGSDRVVHMSILALRRVASGSHFTAYERVGG